MSAAEKVLIAGTGSLACYFAARTARCGKTPILMGSWPEGLRALRESGVLIREDEKKWKSYPVRILEEPLMQREFRLVILLAKAWQTAGKAKLLDRVLAPEGTVLSLQNGLGNKEILEQVLGPDRVNMGVTTAGITLLEPGRIRVHSEGDITLTAALKGSFVTRYLEELGFPLRFEKKLNTVMWHKLAVNAAINPLTALLNIPNGELLRIPSAVRIIESILEEVCRVAAASGISLDQHNLMVKVQNVAARTTENRSSMLQDVSRGRQTEIDWINGAVVRAGRKHAVHTPVNQVMVELIHAAVDKRKKEEP